MGEQSMTITLNGSDLTVTQVLAAARQGEAVALAPEAIAGIRQARAVASRHAPVNPFFTLE
jgi:histidine ammonia-lyase